MARFHTGVSYGVGSILAVGALIGLVTAWTLYEGQLDFIGINQLCLAVSPAIVDIGIVWAAVVGLLGGLLPSIQATRRPVAEALRTT